LSDPASIHFLEIFGRKQTKKAFVGNLNFNASEVWIGRQRISWQRQRWYWRATPTIATSLRNVIQIKRERKKNNLSKEDSIEVMGKVVEKFKAGMFAIELESGPKVLATMAGRLRRNRIKIMNGDRVSLELSPYDLTKGRITYRHK
jgi:translation initiation factor IF-1